MNTNASCPGEINIDLSKALNTNYQRARSLDAGMRALFFFVPLVIDVLLIIILSTVHGGVGGVLLTVSVPLFFIWGVLVSGIIIPNQWETLAVFRVGKLNRVVGPGFRYIIPFIEFGMKVDMRVLTIEVAKQSVITKDNIPIEIDGVLFFQVEDASKAIVNIQDYNFAISEYAKNSLRDVVGGLTLDELLSEREKIQDDIKTHIQEKVKEWGLQADSIRLQDIQMPEDLKRVMSRQASAEREKRATIIKAEGDKLASVNLAGAADIMSKNPGAMQLRALQTIDGLGTSASNTVVLFPYEIVDALKTYLQNTVEKKGD